MPDSTADQTIPIIDIGPYREGEPGAAERAAAELRHALTRVGFYFVRGHGVPQDLIDATFGAAADFHAQPLEAKLALKLNHHNIGYLPMRGNTLRTSTVQKDTKPNLNEAFFVKRDLPPDHPDVVAGKRFRGANRWPEGLAGFRETVVAYCSAMERLALSLLPLYARALDLAPDWFAEPFREPQYTLRMTHYPRQEAFAGDEFGLAPHTDTSFMTLLAQNEVPGLSIRTPEGEWLDAPAVPGTFVVNGGEMLRRWTNERFLATPHRVINRSGRERYAIPFFFDCTIDHAMTSGRSNDQFGAGRFGFRLDREEAAGGIEGDLAGQAVDRQPLAQNVLDFGAPQPGQMIPGAQDEAQVPVAEEAVQLQRAEAAQFGLQHEAASALRIGARPPPVKMEPQLACGLAIPPGDEPALPGAVRVRQAAEAHEVVEQAAERCAAVDVGGLTEQVVTQPLRWVGAPRRGHEEERLDQSRGTRLDRRQGRWQRGTHAGGGGRAGAQHELARRRARDHQRAVRLHQQAREVHAVAGLLRGLQTREQRARKHLV
ncbi:MAG: isopenicillin N synthase family dioxygenase, partial [Alphaproteobacteria bacterium]